MRQKHLLHFYLGTFIKVFDPVFGGLAVSLIFGTFASTVLKLFVILSSTIFGRGGKQPNEKTARDAEKESRIVVTGFPRGHFVPTLQGWWERSPCG